MKVLLNWSQPKSDAHSVSGHKPDEQPLHNSPESITKPDQDENLAVKASVVVVELI